MHAAVGNMLEVDGRAMTFRIEFASRAERDENVRDYGSVLGGGQTFERLNEFLAKKGVRA